MHTPRRLLAVALVVAALAAGAPTPASAAALTRYAGNDRYATAAKISEQSFAAGAPVAFIAAGQSFPDALAAAPAAAAAGGPILLTQQDALSTATTNELDRLEPQSIVVLGGTSAISAAVVTQLAAFTTGAVHRIAGADRYATAVQVAVERFPSPVTTVYVASGEAFPDALAGAAVAGRDGSPLLLVTHDGLPAGVAAELTRLTPSTIVVLGGPGALSSDVETALQPYATSVVRRGGDDRYQTAIEVAKTAFPSGASSVFMATGVDFPDALAGAVIVARAPGPVLLVPGTCVPPDVDVEIDALGPATLVVLGGPGAVTNGAAAREVCEDS